MPPLQSADDTGGSPPENADYWDVAERADIIADVLEIAGRPSKRILIEGEPGIGKSTLLDRAVRQLAEAGFRILRANPVYAEYGISYSTLWDLVAELDGGPGAPLPAGRGRALDVALKHVPSDEAVSALAVAVAVEELLAATSNAAPLVMVIDDIQWADAESLRVLERATRRLSSERVYVLAARRWVVPAARLEEDLMPFQRGDTFQLSGLSASELGLIARSASQHLSDAQLLALHDHTAGNPMWALEIMAGGRILELGALTVGTIEAPATLASTVSGRLLALDDRTRDVVSVVALIGAPPPEEITGVLGDDSLTLEALADAENAGFIVASSGRIRIRHPVYASTALSLIPPARRRSLHRAISTLMWDPEMFAQHLEQSEPEGYNETIALALMEASTVARKRGAALRAAHFATQAVNRTAPGSTVYDDRLLAQAEYLFVAGQYAEAARALTLIDGSRLGIRRYDVFIALSVSAIAATRGSGAARLFLDQQAVLVASDAARLPIVDANIAEDDALGTEERAVRARDALVRLPSEDAPNAAHRALGALIQAQLDQGLGLDEAALAISADRERDSTILGLNDTALAQRGFFARDVDDIDGSRHALATMAQRAADAGEDGMERVFMVHAAATEVIAGDTVAARRHFDRTGLEPTDEGLPPSVIATLGMILLAEDDTENLARLLDSQRDSQTGSAGFRDLSLRGLAGLSAAAREDWSAAVVELRSAVQAADDLGLTELGRRFRTDLPLVEALFENGDNEEASGRLRLIGAFLGSRDRPLSLIGFHRAQSMEAAVQGDLDRAHNEATRAVELGAAAAHSAAEATALVQRSRILRRLRKAGQARRDLERAAELAAGVGNRSLVKTVERSMSSVRRTRSVTELTPAETRVLERIQLGESNSEIARALFVSIRTVESHVSSIQRKSGTTSRLKLIAGRAQPGPD